MMLLRKMCLSVFLLLFAVAGTTFGREACPVFKIGSYGGGFELWYAKYCDGPQFTTIVVPGGTMSANCGSMACVTGLPGVGPQGPRYSDTAKGGYINGANLFLPTQGVTHEASLIVTGTEEWYISLGGNKFAKVIRVTYPTQPVSVITTLEGKAAAVATQQISGFRAIYAFEIAKGGLPDSRFIEAETLRGPTGPLKLHRIAFEISDSEAIITEVQMKKP